MVKLVKKPAKVAPPKPEKDVSKHVIADLHGEIKTLEAQKAELKAEIDDLKDDLHAAINDCSEWVAKWKQLSADHEQLQKQLQQGGRDASAQTARYQALLKPFIACAKGESMTIPSDWEALKEL
jgi:chromosome segregation ATPase